MLAQHFVQNEEQLSSLKLKLQEGLRGWLSRNTGIICQDLFVVNQRNKIWVLN